MDEPQIHWREISPADATSLNLRVRLDIYAPTNEMGERCPWPWEPQQLLGAPMGQYHCGYCGGMQVAGVPHFDFTGMDDEEVRATEAQEGAPSRP